MWDVHLDSDAPFLQSFRSAPDRDLLAAALALPAIGGGARVLELGCGASRFLPHIAAVPGVTVAGVDFSERGVALTVDALRRVGADPSGIVLGRIEDYVPDHLQEFDVVLSFGLVEHFADLNGIVAEHFRSVRPGGTVMITAPNLSALNRYWARLASPDIFTWHRPISARQVVRAIQLAGGRDIEVLHLGGVRLFAHASGAISARSLLTNTIRKVVNGVGEALFRLSPTWARRIGGRFASPMFAVTATSEPG